MTNMTYAQALEIAINTLTDETAVERLTALKASIEKRNSKERKPSKKQTENEGIKSSLLSLLADGESHRCNDLATALDMSGQKCSALLKQLVDAGMVDKVVEKRVTYFKTKEEE